MSLECSIRGRTSVDCIRLNLEHEIGVLSEIRHGLGILCKIKNSEGIQGTHGKLIVANRYLNSFVRFKINSMQSSNT